jgi:hypothetical protein
MSSEHEKFIENVSYIKDGGQKIHRVVHINCGDGLYYELCNESLPDVEYLGYASSKKSAELLKSRWDYDSFFYRKLTKLDEVLWMDTDLLVLSIDEDFKEEAKSVLELEFSNIIIPSLEINFENQEDIFEVTMSNGYEYIFQPLNLEGDLYLLRLQLFPVLKELHDKSV